MKNQSYYPDPSWFEALKWIRILEDIQRFRLELYKNQMHLSLIDRSAYYHVPFRTPRKRLAAQEIIRSSLTN